MTILQLSPELWRFGILIAILIFHRSAYKLVARIMDNLSSATSKFTSNPPPESPDSRNPSASPRLSSFHRRFRSSASTSTSDNMSVTETTTKSEAARSAKRFLRCTIRDDWTYPSPEPSPVPGPIYREPLHYRVRTEGSSEPEPLSDEPHDARDPIVFTDSDPYKFENPDAVARTILERKRKRRRLFREELEWNDGLRMWVECRNAWCGAVGQRPEKRKAKSPNQENGRRLSGATDESTPLSPLSQISGASSSPLRSASDSENDGGMESSEEDQEPLLPVYASLLPEDNPIRASIKPSMYPAIYSKVVLQGLTPNVPVPLSDIIGALVQGWKSEGNWPPKDVAPTTSVIPGGGKRASQLLKFSRRENAVAEKGRMRKGVGAVRKALGLGASNGEMDQVELNFAVGEAKTTWSIDQTGLMEDAPRMST